VRGPRAGGRDRAPEPYGLEAREFLRKKLIGKEVTVKMEYTRKIGFQPGQEQAPAVPGQEVSPGPAIVLGAVPQRFVSSDGILPGAAGVLRCVCCCL
jgi:staphylococcal nuclease domain-containing protein 1